jgi:hypothetical protein
VIDLNKLVFLFALALSIGLGAAPSSAYLITADTPSAPIVCSDSGCSNGNPTNLINLYLNGTGPQQVYSASLAEACFIGGCFFSGINQASVDLSTGQMHVLAIGDYNVGGFAGGTLGVPVALATAVGVLGNPSGNITISMFTNGNYTINQNSTGDATLDLVAWYYGTSNVYEDTGGFGLGVSPTGTPVMDTFSNQLSVTVPYQSNLSDLIVYASVFVSASNSATVDFYNTATFGITLPNGVTYTSPLTFAGPEAAISEPPTMVLLCASLFGLTLLRFGRAR